MYNLNRYQFVFFDCDGVILNSNQIKTEAFRNAVSYYSSQLVDEFIQFHQENGGASRYVKFEYFYKDMLGLDDYSTLRQYASEVRSGLLKCTEVDGVRNILKLMNCFGIPCFVVSGGDEKELNDVFNIRGLDKYFSGIFGSPATKIQNLGKIMFDKGDLSSSIFFGDSKNDLEAAENYGMDFVYVSQFSEWKDGVEICQSRGYDTIHNFLSLC